MKVIFLVATMALSADAVMSAGGSRRIHSRRATASDDRRRPGVWGTPLARRGGADAPTDASVYSQAGNGIKKALVLSPSELKINLVQLPLLLCAVGLVRVPSVAAWLVKILGGFPHHEVLDYERLSAVNWWVHYCIIAYNIGIFQSLLKDTTPGEASDTKKKRAAYAIIFAGLGQFFIGFVTMLSHSLVGTGLKDTEQALHNLTHSSIMLSAMAIGGPLLLPVSWGIVFSLVVGAFTLNGLISFGNVPGIMLANLGVLAVLCSSANAFPLKFKLGYVMLSMAPVAVLLLEKIFLLHPATDLGHTLGAAWVLLCTILQRWSLLEQN